MVASKILVPTDFSVSSEAALEKASTLARAKGATLLILHVAEPVLAYGPGIGVPMPDVRSMEQSLQEVVPPDSDVAYEHRFVVGRTAQEILRLADEENVEMIVMGTHGRTGLSRLLMGSVAEAVVRGANCPVLTIKQPEPATAKPRN